MSVFSFAKGKSLNNDEESKERLSEIGKRLPPRPSAALHHKAPTSASTSGRHLLSTTLDELTHESQNLYISSSLSVSTTSATAPSLSPSSSSSPPTSPPASSSSSNPALSSSAYTTVFSDTAKTAVLNRELTGDALLRILSEKEALISHEIMLYAETGNVAGLIELVGGINHQTSDTAAIQLLQKVRGLGGYTPLHHACNRGHAVMVSELLKFKVNINATNDNGETPLHLAAYSGNLLVVDQLLDRGIDVNKQNIYGETALFYAARKDMPALVRLLLQRGAKKDIEDRYGDLAIDCCNKDYTRRAFETAFIDNQCNGPALGTNGVKGHLLLSYKELVHIFKFLDVRSVCSAACVSGKWHRVSEAEEIWKNLGRRRWELALHSSVGFYVGAASSFRSSRRPSKDVNKAGGGTGSRPGSGGGGSVVSSDTSTSECKTTPR